jgi:chitinase
LSVATIARAEYVDFAAIEPYVDLVNIMAYDLDNPPYHHAPLFRSNMTHQISCEESVLAHIKAGIPPEKLTLGIPFYGHISKEMNLKNGDYKNLVTVTKFTRCWDDVAKVPYMTNENGEYICSYEDPRSIECKCQYIKKMQLAGAMYWEYNCDDDNSTLIKAVYNSMTK